MAVMRARVLILCALRSEAVRANCWYCQVQPLGAHHFSVAPEDQSQLKDRQSSPGGQVAQAGGSGRDNPYDKELFKHGAKDASKWGEQLAWITSIMEPVLKLYRRALPPGAIERNKGPASTRSLVDIAASLHRSSTGMQNWGLADLTLGLYLLSVRHDTEMVADTIPGVEVTSDLVVLECIYHVELAKGAYAKNVAGLARSSMLRECNIVKFVGEASVMRPAYYIGIDTRHKLVVMGIRGTHSVHDVITDLASHGDHSASFEGGSVHYGSAEAALWFLQHETTTLKKCVEENKGYRLRIVGHSLGGATAALLALMLRKLDPEELGFCPGIVSAVTVAAPPCVSKALAVETEEYITAIVLQDDVVPRMSASSLVRLRNEILQLDWASVVRDGDARLSGIMDLVAGTMQAVSSVQDVARRYASYARISSIYGIEEQKDCVKSASSQSESTEAAAKSSVVLASSPAGVQGYQELVCPGKLYHIRSKPGRVDSRADCPKDGFVLLEGRPGSNFGRIVLTGSLLADHKCDSHYYALRDVLKGLEISGHAKSR